MCFDCHLSHKVRCGIFHLALYWLSKAFIFWSVSYLEYSHYRCSTCTLICQCNLIAQSEQTMAFPFFMLPDVHSHMHTHTLTCTHTLIYTCTHIHVHVCMQLGLSDKAQGFSQLRTILRPFSGHFNSASGFPKLFHRLCHFYFG